MSHIQSFGAAETVTGSCHLIHLDSGPQVMIDCGYFQGGSEQYNSDAFNFDPEAIDVLLITHAHLDHIGRIPILIKKGFKGRIISLRTTMELARVVLMDSAKIAEADFEIATKQAKRSGDSRLVPPPLFNMDDVRAVFDSNIQYADYNAAITLVQGVKATFRNAGHILGSATIQIDIEEKQQNKILVFSGDLGSTKALLMPLSTPIKKADVLYIESTYGDQNHRRLKESIEEFKTTVINTLNNQGNVVIPSFAIERSQEILLLLKQMYYANELPKCRVFLDSPMAIKATQIYSQHYHELNGSAKKHLEQDGNLFDFPYLQYTLKNADSVLINELESGCIIIAGSGMCTGGRILQHFKHRLSDAKNSVIFVGYQVEGTLGRKMIDGIDAIQLHHKTIAVNAKIHMIKGFSAHADQSDLLKWMHNFEKLGQINLVHGDPDKQATLKHEIKAQLNKNAHIVKYAEKVAI
ncbi:MAG: metallo-beta-lactamase family protein [Thiomicrorhabdus sp.]|nr:MAG: metallo-beta-lactamase family protein [Thiomicrorhabdus sp.]